MTNPLTEAREAIAASLTGLGWNVYAGPRQQVTTPAAVLVPGDPWSEPLTWSRTTVRWIATLTAGQLDSAESAYERLEQMLWDAVAKLRADGYAVDTVRAPRTQRFGQADLAAIDVAVRVQVDDSVPAAD
jgi:hypothetical protein